MIASTVLIVDDDPTTHDVLGSYLELAGYGVLHALDGQQGLTIIREQQPHLVLMDVQMPEMDGFQALEQLRRERLFADLPVLMLTSLDRSNLKVKGLELGAEDYITKPYNKAELLARIKSALRRTGRSRALEGTLKGELADISLPEVLQTLEMGRKTAQVVFPEMNGEIRLLDGTLVQASQGRYQGADAVQRLFFLGYGSFSATFEEPSEGEKSIAGVNLTHVIMDAATVMDEVHAILDPIAAGNPLVDGTGADLAELGEDAALLPQRLAEILVRRPGNLRSAAALIADLLRCGKLVIIS